MASKKTPPSTSDQGGPDQKGGPTTFVSEGSMKRRTIIDRRVESRRGDRASAAQIGENGAALGYPHNMDGSARMLRPASMTKLRHILLPVLACHLACAVGADLSRAGFGRFSGPSTSTKEQFCRGCCEAFP